MSKKLVITEKPSVAGDIAAALSIKKKHKGYFEGEDYLITWAIGHLLELQDPEDMDKKYKSWLLKDLPIIPQKFKWKVVSRTKDQYRVIQALLKTEDVTSVINACDAGREGELIFREIVEREKVKKPLERLWLSSMTHEAIRSGFDNLLPGSQFDGLADAAKSRSESDWLIGINGTRAVTKRLQSRAKRTVFSVGRVQTPTLSMLVERELEIIAHRPEKYFKVEASFTADDHEYLGTLHLRDMARDKANPTRIFDSTVLKDVQARLDELKNTQASASETRKISEQKPHIFYDLTSLQRDANRRFGYSAQRTLQAAQRLYEQEKLITYPRTDSKYLPEDYGPVLQAAVGNLGDIPSYAKFASQIQSKIHGKDRRFFNNKKVSDHFAIIPTGELPSARLAGDEAKIFDLVVKRVLAAFMPVAKWENVDRVTVLGDLEFRSKGRYLREQGWQAVYGTVKDEGQNLPPLPISSNQSHQVIYNDYDVAEQMTRPPARIGEAKLLGLMEYAGKSLENEELLEAMQGKGIGTPATRADIIENLIRKEYVRRVGSGLKATSKAIRLIDVIRRVNVNRLTSVDLTAEIESKLQSVESGSTSRAEFMTTISEYVDEVIQQIRDFQYEELYQEEPLVECSKSGRKFKEILPGYVDIDNEKFMIHKEYYGRYIDRGTLQDLIDQGSTEELELLYFDGKPFKGKLILGADNSIEALAKDDNGEFNTIRSKSAKELQEAEAIEEEKTTSSEYMDQDGTFRRTKDAYYFEVPVFPKVLGKVPKSLGDGPFISRLPLEVCQRPISESEALGFFQNGKTELLSDFISKRGKKFNAYLYVKSNGKYGFEFESRTKKSKGDQAKNDESKAQKTA
ncbi:MAG: DNA topoisomerase 3 [bacterium]|nr:DNA topoisomerase 3 [bacterium]